MQYQLWDLNVGHLFKFKYGKKTWLVRKKNKMIDGTKSVLIEQVLGCGQYGQTQLITDIRREVDLER